MSFQGELTAAARGLAHLAAHGTTTVTDPELDVALYARATLLDVAVLMHRDLAGPRAHGLHPRLSEVEADPVRAFGQALHGHQPVPARQAPSDALAVDPASHAGRLWKDVARHALQAHHLWQTGTVDATDPDVAWAGLLDAAAVASVVAELDSELAAAAAALPGRREHADKLAKAATSGLRLAAREVAALAAAGPLPAGPEPRPATRREVLPVRTPADAVAAQHQLAVLLRGAGHLRPERVALITLGHHRTLEAVLRGWREQHITVDPALHRAVRDHARLLEAACTRQWAAASIDGGDPFPVRQAALLRQALHPDGSLLRRLLADPTAATDLLAAAADTTTALAEVTDAHLRRGAWLRPTARPATRPATQEGTRDGARDGTLCWAPARSWHEVPAPTQALRRAGVHATALRAAAAPHLPPSGFTGGTLPGRRAAPARPGPRDVLAPAPWLPLLARTTPARPPRPGIPPRPIAPTHVERQMRR